MEILRPDFAQAALTRRIIGAAMEVHRGLGPGLLESAYRACLACELELAGLSTQQEVAIGLAYRGVQVECGYRADLIVENRVLLELKSVEKLLRIHHAQLLTYMKLSNLHVGLLLNFNEPVLKNGIRRFVL